MCTLTNSSLLPVDSLKLLIPLKRLDPFARTFEDLRVMFVKSKKVFLLRRHGCALALPDVRLLRPKREAGRHQRRLPTFPLTTMHVPGPSARLLLHSVSPRPTVLAVVRRSTRLRPLHVAANYARSAPPTSTLTKPQRTRPFSYTSVSLAAQPAHPPAQLTQLVHCPTEEDLRELEDEDADGPEVELIPPEEATLEMTERAAEVRCVVVPLCAPLS